MANNVRAKTTGYVGGEVRTAGEEFVWPDGVPLGKWVEPVAGELFGGKGDHDGDGKPGGAAPKKGKKGKAEAVSDDPIEPFGDAPEPQTIAAAMKDVGGAQPDWVAPGHIVAADE